MIAWVMVAVVLVASVVAALWSLPHDVPFVWTNSARSVTSGLQTIHNNAGGVR